MRVRFRKRFLRDLRKLKNIATRRRVREVVRTVEAADELDGVAGLKKLSGHESFYRVRVGRYRIGLYVDADGVEFVRVLHRREIYRRFP